ncbi:hypothetical protein N7495_001450 [Penicillium taxi]|uniref:uncharacterized protein n=1 Tax=Penicillium taxi TaxID=168475 RepID=UPI0025457A81|nr:uncharacterized protein N7495_001450 [Penicillium taxi]KAJ5908768.1 hypothetical protein N7495_001450 [Penicillium taxi]
MRQLVLWTLQGIFGSIATYLQPSNPIASTLSPDDIPFKLRCAMCSKLAVNAFRLPCCDQSICESCHESLPDTCPVCTHNPLTPDLCKPHKALRTTLKAFLRTAEKKRKDQLAAAPPPASIPTPAEDTEPPTEAPVDTQVAASAEPVAPDVQNEPPVSELTNFDEINPVQEGIEGNVESATNPATEPPVEAPTESNAQSESNTPNEPTQPSMPEQEQPSTNMMNVGPGGWNGMGWNGNFNGMNPYMGNPFNFQNQMGMNMAAGMGMNNMGNFNGQGMYGSVGWDESQLSMWPGAQDNFNPNAFANGSGPPYGGAFGGSNMSYHSNHGYQSGNYGTEYGRGGYRGRGRGYYNGGRGGYGGHVPAYSSHAPDGGYSNTQVPSTDLSTTANTEISVQAGNPTDEEGVPTSSDLTEVGNQQLQVIPTIDSLDESTGQGPYHGYLGQGYGRGGYGGMGGYRNGHMSQAHINPGVEGAPAAPRAMRQGLPNTSVLRQRAFQNKSRASAGINGPGQSTNADSGTPPDSTGARSPSKAPSLPQRAESPPHSPSQAATPRPQSPAPQNIATNYDIRDHRDEEAARIDGHLSRSRSRSRSRSASQASSRRKSYRDSDITRRKDRDRHSDRRDNRSERYRPQGGSRSKSPSRASELRRSDRQILDENRRNGHKRASPEAVERDSGRGGRSRRISRDRSVRRDENRERTRARESDRYTRDRRDRDRGDRDRDRPSERDRRKDRGRDREHGRDRRERDRGRRDDKDRKRSRRDRSESPNGGDRSRARRIKRSDSIDRDGLKTVPSETAPAPEKDPITLEREARNNERMAREKQRRQQISNHGRHY